MHARFSRVQTFILDEADTMLEQGFIKDVGHILRLLPPKRSGWQGMCFSATVPDKIKDVISIVLAPGYTRISTVDRSEPPTHARVPQYHVVIPSVKSTFAALLSLIQHEVGEDRASSKIIVFGTTANMVALYADMFRAQSGNLGIYELHSRMSQPARIKTTDAFKEAASGLMFATDVIGRGMDFPNVTCVIQVGLPMNGEQYVHRVGRTARVDKEGRAVILLTEAEKFFLGTNRQLPIEPYAHTANIVETSASSQGPAAQEAGLILNEIDYKTKQKAYSAYLGFMKGFMNKLQVSAAGLVAMANELAIQGMGCPEAPGIEKRTIGKMGLAGVKGLNYASATPQDHISHNPRGNTGPKRTNDKPRPKTGLKRVEGVDGGFGGRNVGGRPPKRVRDARA